MNRIRRGAQVLAGAETELKELAAAALANNDWDAVATLAGWARQMGAVLREAGADLTGPTPDASSTATATHDHRGADFAQSVPHRARQPRREPTAVENTAKHQTGERAKEGQRKSTNGSGRPTTGKDYPKFAREKHVLIKVGWSKKGRKEYEHRAPKHLLDLLTSSIQHLAVNDARFTVEQLLPLIDLEDETETPSYQTYLCIAWLREHNLLEQHGRQGYSVPHGADLGSRVEKAWNATVLRG